MRHFVDYSELPTTPTSPSLTWQLQYRTHSSGSASLQIVPQALKSQIKKITVVLMKALLQREPLNHESCPSRTLQNSFLNTASFSWHAMCSISMTTTCIYLLPNPLYGTFSSHKYCSRPRSLRQSSCTIHLHLYTIYHSCDMYCVWSPWQLFASTYSQLVCRVL